MSALTAEIEISEAPVALYRLYADDTLLYIGISANLLTRFRHHAKHQDWWPEVTRKTVTLYGSEHDAAIAEEAAIHAERPVRNLTHSGDEEQWGLDAEALRQCRVIRTLRTSHGLSRGELAAATGVSEQYIGHIETGKRAPTYILRRKIADTMRIPLAAITVRNYEDIRDKGTAA